MAALWTQTRPFVRSAKFEGNSMKEYTIKYRLFLLLVHGDKDVLYTWNWVGSHGNQPLDL